MQEVALFILYICKGLDSTFAVYKLSSEYQGVSSRGKGVGLSGISIRSKLKVSPDMCGVGILYEFMTILVMLFG